MSNKLQRGSLDHQHIDRSSSEISSSRICFISLLGRLVGAGGVWVSLGGGWGWTESYFSTPVFEVPTGHPWSKVIYALGAWDNPSPESSQLLVSAFFMQSH